MSDAPAEATVEDLEDDPSLTEADVASAPGGSARGFLAGLLLGTVLGLTVALLYAPEPGEDTRRKLGKGLRRLRDRAEEETDELRRRARKRLARIRR